MKTTSSLVCGTGMFTTRNLQQFFLYNPLNTYYFPNRVWRTNGRNFLTLLLINLFIPTSLNLVNLKQVEIFIRNILSWAN